MECLYLAEDAGVKLMLKKITLLIMLLLCLCLWGCAKPGVQNTNSADYGSAYTAVDDAGRTLKFKEKPHRIVSLTYGTDEIITDLVDLKRIVAYSRWAGDNGITFITKEQAFKVGCKVHDNLESILKLQPDLVVASIATSNDVISSLENVGIPVYIARSPHNYEEMRSKVMNLAQAVGEKEQGQALVQRMDERLAKLEQKLSSLPSSERKVAVAFSFTSAMGRRGDLLDSMLTMAHVINGAAAVTPPKSEHGSVIISKEMVVRINPDIFLLPTWNYNDKQDVQGYAHQGMNDPAYKNVKAVQNGQLRFVSDKYRYVSSHHIVEAIEEIAKAVYPELFKEGKK